jgi:adenosine/AMP kinase
MDEIFLKYVEIEKPEDMNFILGQTHFIKSAEDLYATINPCKSLLRKTHSPSAQAIPSSSL